MVPTVASKDEVADLVLEKTHPRRLETISGPLAKGYKQCVGGSFQEASEIQNQRRIYKILKKIEHIPSRSLKDDEHNLITDLVRANIFCGNYEDIMNTNYYTANLFLARLNNNYLEYGLSGRAAFDKIAGENIDNFVNEILSSEGNLFELKDHLFKLKPNQIRLIPTLIDIVWAKASRLPSKKFAEKVYGSFKSKYFSKQESSDFKENMELFMAPHITLPSPEYIREYIKPGEVFVLPTKISSFSSGFVFEATHHVDFDYYCLRGIKIKEEDKKDGLKI